MVDISRVHRKIAAELKPFSDITKSLSYLVSQNHFELLAEVLDRIYQAEGKSDRSKMLIVKEHLKVIVPCMINHIWGGNEANLESRLSGKISEKSPSPERTSASRLNSDRSSRRSKKSPRLNAQSPKRSPRSPTGYSTTPYEDLMRKSSPSRLTREISEPNFGKSLTGLSYKEASSLSDFCHIKGYATFARTKRPLTKGHEGSPGPAAYRGDKLDLKANSPRIVIPQGGKRGDNFPAHYSPGPAAYYVIRHYLAKH